MKPKRSKANRASHAANVTARSAQSSGSIKCYVERFEMHDGRPNLRFREKSTRRTVRIVTDDPLYRSLSPMTNLLQDCFAHGGGLVEPRSRAENVTILAPIRRQSPDEVVVLWDGAFSLKVNILTDGVASPPTSVWCYIEEYTGEQGAQGLRLRQKLTGRKVEMYGESKEHLTRFLASPQFTGARDLMPNLYEKEGYGDYVLVSGGTAADSYDVILFEDGSQLTYILGPTPDTAYRDAFRVQEAESPAQAHARTATVHFNGGRYREAVLSARLAVEMASGGSGQAVKVRMAMATSEAREAADLLFASRNVAVHEGGTRVEQKEARGAILAMETVLEFLRGEDDPRR